MNKKELEESRIKVNIGIWVNRKKLRRVLDKLSMAYGIALPVLALVLLLDGNLFLGIASGILALPFWIIQLSKMRFDKIRGFIE